MINKFEPLEKIIRKYMRKCKIPGLAISMFQGDRIIYSKGFGARDLEKFLPMTPQTLIGIGSITKSFTASAIMKLVEQGKISLEDSGSKYLKFAPFSTHPDIKIKHMLSHSTGVPAADTGLFSMFYTFGDYRKIYPATTREDFEAHLGEPEDFIIFKPGEKFYYNNDIFTCLGFIIEQISGLSYSKYIHDEILDLLGMERAVFSKDKFEKDDDKMTGYLPHKEEDIMVPKKNDVPLYEYLSAGGGLYVSMEEMMNYAQFLLQHGNYQGHQLLTPHSIEELWSPKINSPYGYGENPKYCLGWVKDDNYFPQTFMHHGGGLGTSCAFFGLIPDLKIGVIVGQNSCTGNSSVIVRAALSILLNIDPMTQIKELEMERIIEEISGNYKSSHDLYNLKIYLKETILYADIEIDDGAMCFPLMVKDLDNLEFTVCSTLPEIRQGIKFLKNSESNKIEFVTYDRYLYRKK
ncbi:MAG: serine hydrolase domain-containing protein [Promethearchaeota archaeon]